MRQLLIQIIAVSLLFASTSRSENSVTLSRIEGLDPSRGLMIDVPIKYFIKFDVGNDNVIALVNRFKIFSLDGSNWQPVTGNEIISLDGLYDGYHGFSDGQFVSDGTGMDTLSYGAFSIQAEGLPSNFSGEIFYFETKLTESQIGKSLCFDSLHIEPFDTWVWQFPNFDTLQPGWSGQVCYEIVDCCVGLRGDVNGDGVNANILDLTDLVDYLFRDGSSPVCKNESDVNSDSIHHNMGDLTFLVDFIFRNGLRPETCPDF